MVHMKLKKKKHHISQENINNGFMDSILRHSAIPSSNNPL